ncbi:MAG: head-tail adaptor protein [Sphingomonadaceae bacterium]
MNGEIAGRLKQRVFLERRQIIPDGQGGSAEHWRPVGVYWAEMRPVDRLSLSTGGGDTQLTRRRWRVLMRQGVELALGMRLLWKGLDLRITGVDYDPATPDRVTVVAEELGA